jgi:hypothetical protein
MKSSHAFIVGELFLFLRGYLWFMLHMLIP